MLFPRRPEHLTCPFFDCKDVEMAPCWLWISAAKFNAIRKIAQEFESFGRRPKAREREKNIETAQRLSIRLTARSNLQRVLADFLGSWPASRIPMNHGQDKIRCFRRYEFQVFPVRLVLHYIGFALVPLTEGVRARKNCAVKNTAK
jgi:hypothetical protein